MKELPSEILSEIFFQLHQHDQMECMLVCHRWHQIIEELVLYNTVYIYSRESFNKLTKQIQRRSEIARKIDRLIICIGYFDEIEFYKDFAREVDTFLRLLHHLRTLCYHMSIDQETYINEIQRTTPYPWLKHIQHISEQSNSSLFPLLLSSTIYSNLTTLEICDFEAQAINFLKNAPALKTLAIRSSTIGISELELIHKVLPHLTSITFDNASVESFEINKDIIPATNITECGFQGFPEFQYEKVIQLLVYISIKYPNISALSYSVHYGCPDNDDMKKLVDYGWTPLLQGLGCQLKKLCLTEWKLIDSDFFKLLDKFYCQINYLHLYGVPYVALSNLAQSQQVLYIQTLVMKIVQFKTFDWLKELKQLKKLKLMECGWDDPSEVPCLNMNDLIVNSPPTLRSLHLDCGSLFFDLECTSISSIETLSLQWMTLPEKTDLFISRHFPQLSTLILGIPEQRGTTFDLSTMDLYSISFTSFGRFNEYYYIMVSNNNNKRWYSVNGRIRKVAPSDTLDNLHTLDYIPFKSWPENKSGNVVDFTLICNSVKNLTFAE